MSELWMMCAYRIMLVWRWVL